jgi:hypothetical protein
MPKILETEREGGRRSGLREEYTKQNKIKTGAGIEYEVR